MKLENINIIIIALVLSLQLGGFSRTVSQNIGVDDLKDNINDMAVLDMENNSIQLSDYYDKKVLLIVNVASECGYTYQYEGLEEIYKKYKSQGFEILAFPSNNFGGQEPGTNEEIKSFCSINYGITFKLFNKVKILGKEKSSLYERLTNNTITEKADIKWNFEKFIISKEGKILARFNSKTEPDAQELTNIIEQELNKG